jgi:hypothetical protein
VDADQAGDRGATGGPFRQAELGLRRKTDGVFYTYQQSDMIEVFYVFE